MGVVALGAVGAAEALAAALRRHTAATAVAFQGTGFKSVRRTATVRRAVAAAAAALAEAVGLAAVAVALQEKAPASARAPQVLVAADLARNLDRARGLALVRPLVNAR